ncbi:radical SAM/SPASM domain-containing protein [Desulfosediminicola flagellatus]|uniref:radical SAM/SPASM domain-containing protein n=1 Tax=Desulfosediminicola flagellatus TaxID=2569541 RepID=UPI00142E9E4D|nr:radical SAM protein [Desulfosediminicola flagellatus]
MKNVDLPSLKIELTQRCNNRCIHCYNNLAAENKELENKELPTSEFRNIIFEAVELGCMSILFTGGEPLLRSDFLDLYIFSRRLGLSVTIFTNATLITQDHISLFSKVPPLNPIEVTLYGMTKGTYEEVSRIPGSYDAAIKGIKLLAEACIPFIIKGAFVGNNRNEIPEFDSWVSSLGHMNGALPTFSIFFDLRVRRDSESKNSRIESLRPAAKQALEFLTRNEDEFLAEIKSFCSQFATPPGLKLLGCEAGSKSISVDPYGMGYPCLLLRHPDFSYDLLKGSLKCALDQFKFKAAEMSAQPGSEYDQRCAKCFLKSLCQQCPARSWIEHGTLDSPVEYHCQITHAQAVYLGLITEGEKLWEVPDWKTRLSTFIEKS